MSPIPFSNFSLAAPEIYLLAAICVILLVDLFLPERARQVTYLASVFVLAVTAIIVANAPSGHEFGFHGMYVRDGVGRLLKLITCGTVAATFLYSRDYLIARGLFRGEFFILGLFAVLGIFVMISAGSLLTLYLGIEILALSQYTLVAFDRDSPVAAESAMKYFVLGAIASGMILYGISIIYGVTGTFSLGDLIGGLQGDMVHNVGFLLGLSFLIAGIAFKFGAAPFHMWVPDVYHGAPTAVTLFLGAAPKLAYFALAYRVLAEGLGSTVEAWRGMVVILALLSIALGSLVGLAQTNIKRLFAYSTIANVGFVLLGIGAGTPEGYRAALFYTITYVLMAIGSFATIILLSKRGFEADRIDDFKGLARSSPWFAWMMPVCRRSSDSSPSSMCCRPSSAVGRRGLPASRSCSRSLPRSTTCGSSRSCSSTSRKSTRWCRAVPGCACCSASMPRPCSCSASFTRHCWRRSRRRFASGAAVGRPGRRRRDVACASQRGHGGGTVAAAGPACGWAGRAAGAGAGCGWARRCAFDSRVGGRAGSGFLVRIALSRPQDGLW